MPVVYNIDACVSLFVRGLIEWFSATETMVDFQALQKNSFWKNNSINWLSFVIRITMVAFQGQTMN